MHACRRRQRTGRCSLLYYSGWYIVLIVFLGKAKRIVLIVIRVLFWLLESPNSSQLTFNRSVGFWSFILHLGTFILWFFESHSLFNLWLATSQKLITMTGQSLIWTIQCLYFFYKSSFEMIVLQQELNLKSPFEREYCIIGKSPFEREYYIIGKSPFLCQFFNLFSS